jgi:lipopolysaccharide export system protein LptA
MLGLGVSVMFPVSARALPAWNLVYTSNDPGVQFVRLAPPRVTLPTTGDEPVTILAKQYRTEGDNYIATGEVTLTQGTLRLSADRLTANKDTGQIDAEGNVVLTQPGRTVRGQQLSYNTDTQRIHGTAAETVVNGVIVRARTLDGTAASYSLAGASVTTCDLPKPHYRLSARSVVVTPNDRVVAKQVGVWFLGLRLFVVPRLTARIGESRGEGGESIFPRFGSNSRDGFFVGKVLPLLEQPRLYVDFDGRLSVRRGLTGGFDAASPLGPGWQLISALKYRDEAPNQRTQFLEVDRLPEVGVLWLSPTPTPRGRRPTRRSRPPRGNAEAPAEPATAAAAEPDFHPAREVGSDAEHQPGLLSPPSPGRWFLRAQATAGYFHQLEGLAASGEADSLSHGRLDFRATASRSGLRIAGVKLPILQLFARESFYDDGESLNLFGLGARQSWRLSSHWSSRLQAFFHQPGGSTPFAFDRVEIRTELQPELIYQRGGTTLGWLGRVDLDRGQLFDQEYSIARVLHCLEPRLSYRSRRRQITLEVRIVGLEFE